MVLNQEEDMCNGMMFDNGFFSEECTTKDLVDFDDCKFDEGSEEKNIADLLHNDPFGMGFSIDLFNVPFGEDFDIRLPVDLFEMDQNIEATVAAITGWVDDFGQKAYRFGIDEASEDKNADVDYNILINELNCILTNSMNYGQDGVANDGLVMSSEDGSFEDHTTSSTELVCFGSENYCVEDYENDQKKDVNFFSDTVEGPGDALLHALRYLDIKDLLSVRSVCKRLCYEVQNDTLLWQNIDIGFPICYNITDDDLLRLTNRAQGTLHSLNLEKCYKVTNNGIRRVLESNLELTKLGVPACNRVRIEGLLHDLKVFNSIASPGIKQLRIGGHFGLTKELFKEYKLLLGVDEAEKSNNYKPRIRVEGQVYLSLDDERVLDVEACPRCQNPRQVFDCPLDSCKEKINTTKPCRGCFICIPRCIECGCCLVNKVYEETFLRDLLCMDCFGPPNVTYHFVLCG